MTNSRETGQELFATLPRRAVSPAAPSSRDHVDGSRVPILMFFIRLVAFGLCTLVFAQFMSAASVRDPLSSSERRVIEALIMHIEQLSGAEFIRNGKAYSAATAAKFLRGKWKDRSAAVRNADEFIALVATKSSTTGRPYMIRYSGGREVPSAAVLREALAAIRAAERKRVVPKSAG